MILDKEITVIDNFIDKEYQERIKNTLLSHETNWFYNHNININSDIEPRPCFSHRYFESEYDLHTATGTHYIERERSYLHDMLVPMIDASCKSVEYDYKYIIQGRSFLQLPLKGLSDELDINHVDRTENHLVILYYVKDSDGDTIIYENRYQNKFMPGYYTKDEEEKTTLVPPILAASKSLIVLLRLTSVVSAGLSTENATLGIAAR